MDFQIGTVFYLPFSTLRGQAGIPKDKYAILVETNPDTAFLLISSAKPNFVTKNSALANSFVQIDVESHPFLDRDSWVDCMDVYREYTTFKLTNYLKEKPEAMRGAITLEMAKAIRSGVEKSKRLDNRYRRDIQKALDGLINRLQAEKKAD